MHSHLIVLRRFHLRCFAHIYSSPSSKVNVIMAKKKIYRNEPRELPKLFPYPIHLDHQREQIDCSQILHLDPYVVLLLPDLQHHLPLLPPQLHYRYHLRSSPEDLGRYCVLVALPRQRQHQANRPKANLPLSLVMHFRIQTRSELMPNHHLLA